MKIMRFEQLNENIKMNFSESFNKFIKGKIVISDYTAFDNYDYMDKDYHKGYGIIVEGDYKMIHDGGGSSGEDCNTTYIISPDNKIISKLD